MNPNKIELCKRMKRNGASGIRTLRDFERAYHRESRTTLRICPVLILFIAFIASIFLAAYVFNETGAHPYTGSLDPPDQHSW